MSEVSIDEEKALAVGCRLWTQIDKAADKDSEGLPTGRHLEAIRVALNRLKRLFPKDFQKKLDALVAEAVASGTGEGGKPN